MTKDYYGSIIIANVKNMASKPYENLII